MKKNENEPHSEVYCPALATLDLLNQRWTLHIVRTLLDGKKRFNEIARANGINPRTLRERLRALEEEEVISRTVVSAFPPNVEYALTQKGMELNCIFQALSEWGRKWMSPERNSCRLDRHETPVRRLETGASREE